MRGALAAWAVVGACACGKTRGNESAHGGTDAGAADADSAATAMVAPTTSASSATPGVWRGTYRSVASTLYVPPDWKGVRWKVPDTSAGIGDGTLTLTIDPASGRVQGAMTGPLGPATIDGLAAEGSFAAKIAREDPADRGFAGTLVGTMGGGRADGTMNVSLGEASAIRAATFVLTPSGGLDVPR
jgi:hypothetical protein